MRHAARWGVTPARLAASSADPAAEVPDPSPTPPPSAVELPSERAGIALRGIPRAKRLRTGLVAMAGLVAAVAVARIPLRHRDTSVAATVTTAIDPSGIDPSGREAASRAGAPRSAPATGSTSTPEPTVLLPSTSRPTDGEYDLIVHLHGEADVVRESLEIAGVDAVLASLHLGDEPDAYRHAFAREGNFESLLERTNVTLRQSGLPHPRLRRLALVAWGAGHAGIGQILEHRRAPDAESDPLDAIVLLDSLRLRPEGTTSDDPDRSDPVPFLRAAKAAASESILFVVTHSEQAAASIDGTTRSAERLLTAVGARPVRSSRPSPAPVHPKSAVRSIGRATPLEMATDGRSGTFHVTGFRGSSTAFHGAHLVQMAAIALPELATRWSGPPPTHRHTLSDDPSSSEDE